MIIKIRTEIRVKTAFLEIIGEENMFLSNLYKQKLISIIINERPNTLKRTAGCKARGWIV